MKIVFVLLAIAVLACAIISRRESVAKTPDPETSIKEAKDLPARAPLGTRRIMANGAEFVFFDQTSQKDTSLNFKGWHEILEGHQMKADGKLLVCHREMVKDKWHYLWVTLAEYSEKYDTQVKF